MVQKPRGSGGPAWPSVEVEQPAVLQRDTLRKDGTGPLTPVQSQLTTVATTLPCAWATQHVTGRKGALGQSHRGERCLALIA